MRDIKFRSWDKFQEEMVSWKDIELQKSSGEGWYFVGYKANKAITKFDHDQILMQYTGLKDKNGKEIFEGDIVKVMGMTLAVVKYSENRGAYYLECRGDIGDVGLICQYDTIEVIGNIYENPELLEVK